jgi:anti-anti-sigma regulatory factor
MARPFRHTVVDQKNDIYFVRLRRTRMGETDILEMADELMHVIEQGCRKMVLSLGPGEVECLYSVFLAKLVMVQRHLAEQDGKLKLCDASPQTLEVFEACRLKEYFDFVPDQAAAVAALKD